ncbi:MAG TPA: substrate-binding domain-containing protein [Candidatus Acidoferrales bacterium]|nr:substrate-binding domain-containing protein [Candidatus Acidoferrales bacterium]
MIRTQRNVLGGAWRQRPSLVVAALLIGGVALAACGSTPAPTPKVSASPSASNGVAEAQRLASQAEAPSTWTAPGPQISVSTLSGKSVYLITNGANQFTETVGGGMVAAGAKAGVHVIPDYTTGGIAAADQGFAVAETDHVAAIVVMSFLTTGLAAQIKAATASGIPVIQIGEHDPGALSSADTAAGVYQNVSPSYSEAGALMADFVVADSKGQAHVLLLNSPDVGDANVETAAFESQLAKLCPVCEVKVDGIPEIDRTTELPPAVSSAIVADPKLNYIVPVFDTMYPDFASALGATGAASRIHLVGFDASGAEMALLQQGQAGWQADGGYDDVWLGWAVMDEAFRAMLNKAPVANEDIPLRFFTTATVKGLDFAPGSSPGPWFGNPAFEAGFSKLWSLAG